MNQIKLIISCLLLFASPSLVAQSLELMDGTVMHNEKARDCITVNVDPNPETLEDAWEDYLNDHYDFKLKGKGLFNSNDLYYAEEVNIGKISPKAMNFYTYILESGEGSKMQVFASFGYDIYIQKAQGKEYKAMKEVVEDFLKVYLPTYYNEQVAEMKDLVASLNKDIEKLEKKTKKDREEIKELRKEIEERTKELGEKDQSLSAAERKLRKRKEKLAQMKKRLSKM